MFFTLDFPIDFKEYKFRQIIHNFRPSVSINRRSVVLKSRAYFFKTKSNHALLSPQCLTEYHWPD